jgi:hypothetical protein
MEARTSKVGVIILLQAAANNRKEDAHLLYIMVFASSWFAAPVELRTFIASKRDDFFAVDVIRHCFALRFLC